MTKDRSKSGSPLTTTTTIRQPAVPNKKQVVVVETPIGDPLALSTRDSYVARDDLELGCMGALSSSALLYEHEDLAPASVDVTNGRPSLTNGSASQSPDQARLGRLCTAILDCLPTKDAARSLRISQKYADGYFGYHYPSLLPFYDAFWELNGHAFDRPRNPVVLLALAEKLCRATERRLVVARTNSEYLASISGHNSRWEMIGIMCIEIAMVAWDLNETDALLKTLIAGQQVDKRSYLVRLLEWVRNTTLSFLADKGQMCRRMLSRLRHRAEAEHLPYCIALSRWYTATKRGRRRLVACALDPQRRSLRRDRGLWLSLPG